MSVPMKIGIVCPYNIFRSGGVQEHVLAQADYLRARGHNVKILTPRPRAHREKAPADVLFIGKSTTLKMPISTSLELGASFERDSIDELLEAESFDILHIHEPEVPMLGGQVIAKAKCPLVATFHAFHPQNTAGKTINRFRVPYSKSIFSKLDAITAVSDAAAEFVTAQIDTDDRKVHIIPNGINLDEYTDTTVTKTDTILYVGRLEKRKGVIYLLKAFAELQRALPHVKLVIAGDGPEKRRLQHRVEDLELQNVSFLGYVSNDKKKELLCEAKVFCSPAIFGESFGIVLLEAMACGVPTVAGDNPGYVSVLREMGMLSIVNPKDSSDFARRLQLLLEDDVIRTAWIEWASSYVKQFDYNRVIDQYETLYQSL
jgi:phosphatidyl-myo-inositol alpha-mannosyltransferase